MSVETSAQKKKKIVKRLKVVEAFLKSGNQPEWMILEVLPVIPPELRPLVPLDGGRFATSDLNDLYRRVINRNNRLKRLMELRAPEIIIRNEKRMLQEAVDALFDNGRRGRVITGPNNRPLKSLSDTLKGKQGRFRQNLLGKRVDYSGRSVIVVGPYLKLHQCGLPKKMALELFKPFILRKLEERGIASSIKAAKKIVEKERPEVWDILEEVIKEHPILLNRAPTLHRLGIQAFEPLLVEGKAIEIHPLVCTAFNADFDGDQMAVHIPLSMEAQMEAQVLMLSANNILSPSNGAPVAVPTQDMVFGIYYMTKERPGAKGEDRLFADPEDLRHRVRQRGRRPPGADPDAVERQHHRDHGGPRALQRRGAGAAPLRQQGAEEEGDRTAHLRLLQPAGQRGHRHVPRRAQGHRLPLRHPVRAQHRHRRHAHPVLQGRAIENARRLVTEVEQQYQDGVITNGERYNKVVDIWAHVTEQIADELFREMEVRAEGGEFNPIFMMADSGARGSKQQIRQLAGMRGLMAKPSGEVIETPDHLELPRGAHRAGVLHLDPRRPQGPRRHRAQDGRLRLPHAPARRRRPGRHHLRVRLRHREVHRGDARSSRAATSSSRCASACSARVAAEDIRDPFTGEIIVQASTEINEELAQKIEDSGLERVRIRSALTCESKRGICVLCYGRNLGTGAPGRARRGGGHHRRPVDRRAGHAAHDADVPHRRHGEQGAHGIQARGQERAAS